MMYFSAVHLAEVHFQQLEGVVTPPHFVCTRSYDHRICTSLSLVVHIQFYNRNLHMTLVSGIDEFQEDKKMSGK